MAGVSSPSCREDDEEKRVGGGRGGRVDEISSPFLIRPCGMEFDETDLSWDL